MPVRPKTRNWLRAHQKDDFLMDKSKKKKNSAGSDTAGRQGGNTVPVSPRSSSSEGLSMGSRVRSMDEMDVMAVTFEEVEELRDSLQNCSMGDEEARVFSPGILDNAKRAVSSSKQMMEGCKENPKLYPTVMEALWGGAMVLAGYSSFLEETRNDLMETVSTVLRDAGKRKTKQFAQRRTGTESRSSTVDAETQCDPTESRDEESQTQVTMGPEVALVCPLERGGTEEIGGKERPTMEIGGASAPSVDMEVEVVSPASTEIMEDRSEVDFVSVSVVPVGRVEKADIRPRAEEAPPSWRAEMRSLVREEVEAALKKRGSPTSGARKRRRGKGATKPESPAREKGREDLEEGTLKVPPPERGSGCAAAFWNRRGGKCVSRCFRCLILGHTGVGCTSGVVRGRRCYRCGVSGHRMAGCRAQRKCPLCTDVGAPSEHVLGVGEFCSAIPGTLASQRGKSGNEGVGGSAPCSPGGGGDGGSERDSPRWPDQEQVEALVASWCGGSSKRPAPADRVGVG